MAKLDTGLALKRLDRLAEGFKSGVFMAAQALSVLVGKEETTYSKSTAMQIWLFGYELPETLLTFDGSVFRILTSSKKAKFLSSIAGPRDGGEYSVEIATRNKADGDKENFGKLMEALKGKKLGRVLKDKSEGPFADGYLAALTEAELTSDANSVDIASYIGALLAPKDKTELQAIERAAQLSGLVFNKGLKKLILDVIDREEKIAHSKLAEQTEKLVLEGKFVAKLQMDPESVDVCYEPIIQSGGKYNLKASAASDDNNLESGVIICAVGARYKSYCSNVARTLLVEPTKQHGADYAFLLELQEFVIKAMKPGVGLSVLYRDAVKFTEDKREDLRPHLTKNLGFAIGLEFKDSSLVLNEKNTHKLRKDMTVNLVIGLKDVKPKSGSGKPFSLLLSDIVLVGEEGARTLTQLAKKAYKDISFEFSEEDEEEESALQEKKRKAEEALKKGGMDLDKRTRHDGRTESSNVDKRREHQEVLAKELEDQTRAKLLEQTGSLAKKKQKNDSIAYKTPKAMPESECRKLRIFIDKKHEAVVLPVYGIATPFHVSTIKNLSINEEGDSTIYLRINFNTPAASSQIEGNEGLIFLKEMVFKSTDSRSIQNASRLIKDLRKRYKSREQEMKDLEDLVHQDALVLNKGSSRGAKLNDLYARPNPFPGNKKVQGNLEAHANGFRFTTRRNDKLDILYSNVRQAFYQPCKNEIVILFHFHLKHPILVNKKKVKDVQFYTEVGEAVTDLDKRTRNDRDEIEAEQRERRMRKRLSDMFEKFLKQVEEQTLTTKYPLEFDVPFYDLGFSGVPLKANCLLQPTTYCLVNLTEQPAFVLTLSDVERVHFERVSFGLTAFDIVFIFKDYKRKPQLVSAVPMKQLDAVKEWLDSCDITYTEGPSNLNWAKIMKTILEDPQGFLETGGWTFLLPESEDEDEGDQSEDGSEFVPSGLDESESSEDYTSDSESSGSDGSEEDDEEEEGLDWDDLEKEAAREDRHKTQREREREDMRPSTKRRAQGSAGSKPNKKARKR